ncbi:nucleotidyltransferase domain-containing protein [Candidatus Poribacteria bacterium]|jgi:uncharacterized protein|nr:nucleotidyltransferase domain-containing protein [Candidatus Poribacteria bacterium]MBT5535019.1 nucleotidyltransferase domain-containing protein [Candidatus Poribacteria bacterium]MBT5711946.1 nucleotidyltransferase domain-containing protein [Candidatus Poribacteria bacterium]MBT7096984.1 nucleotidyltransferase domain-containing protein [Candidatus Poribacteria bacterium]MBT7807363.1 nucleotidyltransferase domain-containing protein [Candidatus Poribacteria bacterium]
MSDPWIERFRSEALPKMVDAFRPARVVLFGSRISGRPREESDIDVVLVSAAFEDVPFLRRMGLVYRAVPFPKHVDYLCYTPQEYDRIRLESAIVMDAHENGLVVA